MKLYPKDALQRFEFDQIKEHLSKRCNSEVARELVHKLVPYSSKKTLELRLQQTVEYKEIEENDLPFPEIAFPGLKNEIKWLKIKGARLEGSSLNRIAKVCSVIMRLYSFLTEYKLERPSLHQIVKDLDNPKPIIQLIQEKIDQQGNVRSSASRELLEIRKSLDIERSRSKKKFDSLLKKYRKLGWLREFDESFYNNRRVLAAESEYKRKIKGINHGMSESGKSTFIEPIEMIEINNHIASLEQEELAEINRILVLLTSEVSEYLPSIKLYHNALGLVDFTRAKVRMAIQMDARLPEIDQNGEILLKKAQHPLLTWFLEKEKKAIIPLDLLLNKEGKLLVISGPNAGGKSIALKTLGILQIMLQSGLLIPVKEGSKMLLFNKLFVDIGDDQSIEYELSTYSSRLVKMKYFLEFADKDTIIFIDEFGTGSDPDLGGALAEVMLEELLKKKPYGMITTHYNNIKVFAENNQGISNASMLFERSNLRPLFKLEQGEPGSSFTFEVASKIGLASALLERAKETVNEQKVNFDKVLIQLQSRKNELNRKNRLLSKNQKLLSEELIKMKAENELLDEKLANLNDPENQKKIEQGNKYVRLLELYQKSKNKKDILKRIIIASDKWEVNNKKLKAKDEAEKLREKKARIRKQKKDNRKKKKIENTWIPEVGDLVKLGNGKQTGQVVEIEKNKVLVHFGSMKTIMDIEKVKVVKKAEEQK